VTAAIAALQAELAAALGTDHASASALDRHARAHDASHYLLVPELVATADDAAAVASALRLATRHRVPVTFRSGGTSLSGQASGRGLLLDTRRGFRRVRVLDDGERVSAEPGATLRQVNTHLARHRRALGPDPASEVACTIGGVIANNSSGMAAGIEWNSYRTLESAVVVLASGTIVDTAAADAGLRLRREEPDLVAALERLRDRVRADPATVAEIRERFAMKNTMGYAVNAFLDFDDPLDLLVHLIVGSEGTLAFVADAVFRTVPVMPHAATALLVFESVDAATRALPALIDTGAAALELLDATSLRVARRLADAPAEISGFEIAAHAALLVEYRAADADALATVADAASVAIDALPLARPARLTSDPMTRAALWHVRKGLYTTVAEARPSGTTALLEDIVVPVPHLAAACDDIARLCDRYGYADSVIFGHAKDGNLHFMVTDDFSAPGATERLAAFTDDLVAIVLGHGGNLKAEHGTGRAMAPFLDRQYGPELVAVMRELKTAFDPAGVLNPGVIITDDAAAHVRDLKPVVTVEAEVDRCVECGYCEPVCPSRDLTLTPRQRIVVRRARALAEASGDVALVAELDEAYRYDGVETCAVDGMCATACPVRINTGDLVKRLRAEGRGSVEQRAWSAAAANWGAVTTAAARGLDLAARLPERLIQVPNRAARALLGADTVPLHTRDLPAGGVRRSRVASVAGIAGSSSSADDRDRAAVFLPSCQGAMFAPAEPDGVGVQAAAQELCALAGVDLVVPEGIDAVCCGTPWSSKGYADGHTAMRGRVASVLASTPGTEALPIVVDASSCAEGLAKLLDDVEGVGPVLDIVEFVATRVLPHLPPVADAAKLRSIMLHPTCSSTQAGTNGHLAELAAAVAREVHVPVEWACCGFAGDRGMLHPELTASATAAEADEVRRRNAGAHASCNRACEIAMTRATGRTYRHLIEIVADVHAGRVAPTADALVATVGGGD
jgi:D-lactate dehydrogenase